MGLPGQHVALSVAAHLARTQLIPDPLGACDAPRLSETLDAVGNALARVAPLYVQDPQAGTPRQLLEDELQGAKVKSGATLLVLGDGRSLSAVSIKRADLRQAVAILKALGIQELLQPRQPAQEPAAQTVELRADLRVKIAEVEQLLREPIVPAQAERANALLVAIARDARQGQIANLAMRLMSAVHEARDGAETDARQIGVMLARLRTVIEEARA